MRNHLLHTGKLLDENGYLNEAGYATELVKKYCRADIKACTLRVKEWDYYLVYDQEFAIALTLDNNSYMGLIGASIIDFRDKKEKTTNLIKPFPGRRIRLMESSKEEGTTLYRDRRAEVMFEHQGNERHLMLKMKHFDHDADFFADITLTEIKDGDTMVIATPFSEDKKAFYYNQKMIGMSAAGCVTVGDATYSFDRQSFGLLDWGRGVWTYDNTWYWSAAQGIVNDKVFGFNLGYGFGNTKKATENMIFYDGQAYKIDDVIFQIPKDGSGKEEYLKPWRFVSSDHRFEMQFMPILDRSSKTSLGLILSDQHQVFGRFTGKAVLDENTIIEVSDFLGFAEKVRNKW